MGIEQLDNIDEDDEKESLYDFIDTFLDECDQLNRKQLVYVKEEIREYMKNRGLKW